MNIVIEGLELLDHDPEEFGKLNSEHCYIKIGNDGTSVNIEQLIKALELMRSRK